MNIFFEIHKDIPREGPGNNESTKQALSMIKDLPLEVNVLDIGCGPGMQTIELAENINGKIHAIDVHKPFLDRLIENARQRSLTEKIEANEMSMFELEYEEGTFDLVWCEGAIFIIGFEKGIQEWKKYIRNDGYLVVSEVSYLRNDIPKEPKEFWENAYPEIKGIGDNIKVIEEQGYKPVGHFVLPKKGWWEDYYNPILDRISDLREKYKDNKEANDMMDGTLEEIEMYRKYSDYYGYVFYIMKKI